MAKVTEHLKPTQFKKGQSGNPNGRPKRAVEMDHVRRMTYVDFMELLQKCSHMSREEIGVWLMRKEATMFELMFGKLIAKAATGDLASLTLLTDRLFGKVKDITENLNVNVNSTADNAPLFIVEMTENGRFVTQRPKLLEAEVVPK